MKGWVTFYCILLLNVYFERGRYSLSGGGGEGERGRVRIPSENLCVASTEPNMGLHPTNHGIMTWAEINSWMLNWRSHPVTPDESHFRMVSQPCMWIIGWFRLSQMRNSWMWNILITGGARVLNKDTCFNWLEKLINPCYITSCVIVTSPSLPHLFLPLNVPEWKILWMEGTACIFAASPPFVLESWPVYWDRMFSLICSHS